MAEFEFNNPSGSAYFVIETITTSSFYTGNTPKYMDGIWGTNLPNVYSSVLIDLNLVTSSYDLAGSGSVSINGIEFIFTGSGGIDDDYHYYLDVTSWAPPIIIDSFSNELNYKFNQAQTNPPGLLIEINVSSIDNVTGLMGFTYSGNDQTYGNTIPYLVNGVGGTFSGGLNYNFGLVTSSFMAGVVVQPGYSYFEFTPNITIPVGTIQFRGTGEYTVTIS
jgi:hypothetical protein